MRSRPSLWPTLTRAELLQLCEFVTTQQRTPKKDVLLEHLRNHSVRILFSYRR